MDVYLQGKRIKLDPMKSLGTGGEADVFDLGKGRALKVFKAPDHPDYQGRDQEQQAARARLALHQRKLREFPAGLPKQVVVPEALATDRSGQRIVGYAMERVAPAEPLVRYADPSFRRAGVTNASVVALFRELHGALAALHAAGVVVGDFNDLNVLVTTGVSGRFIDADSFQFGPYPCLVYTERFVDPLLCAPAAPSPRLVRPYTPEADWYAFAVLLMQSLLFVGPYGGIYRPHDPQRRIPHGARPLHRVTVFHPEVQYPKPATSYRVLPDALLDQLCRIFERDERGSFPLRLLEDLQFTTCPRCAVEHARVVCPLCRPSCAARSQQVVQMRGQVLCKPVFETSGVIVHACVERGVLRFLYHEAGAYRREDGAVALQGALDPTLRLRILGAATLVGRDNQLVVLAPGAAPRRLACDSDGRGAALDSNGRHYYWTSAGRLMRDAPVAWDAEASETIGEVLANQTRIWVGPTFGLGLYRAADLSVAFTFDVERRGIRDMLSLPPLSGQLVDAACHLDAERAWLLLALHSGPTTHHLCLVYARSGALEAVAAAEADDGSWLGAALHGKCAVRGMLFAPTDAGVVRIEAASGTAGKTRDFPDTEPFVAADSRLLAGQDGLYVVGRRTISALRLC